MTGRITTFIPFVIPLQQLVTIKFEWATESANYLTDATIASLVSQPVINYRNGIFAGNPMNINNVKDVFLQAINSTLDMSLISTLNVIVTVNGIITGVDAGTNIISGDPYSYWYIASDGVIVDGYNMLEDIIKSYLYTQYNDDDDLQVFVTRV